MFSDGKTSNAEINLNVGMGTIIHMVQNFKNTKLHLIKCFSSNPVLQLASFLLKTQPILSVSGISFRRYFTLI